MCPVANSDCDGTAESIKGDPSTEDIIHYIEVIIPLEIDKVPSHTRIDVRTIENMWK
jgi:hypothetical protein